MMTDLNIRVNYSFRSAIARRGGSPLIRLWRYIDSHAWHRNRIGSRLAAQCYRHLKLTDYFWWIRWQYLIKSRYRNTLLRAEFARIASNIPEILTRLRYVRFRQDNVSIGFKSVLRLRVTKCATLWDVATINNVINRYLWLRCCISYDYL